MEKSWNLRVGEVCWRRCKQLALDEGITVREVVERAVHQYVPAKQAARLAAGAVRTVPLVKAVVSEAARHWEPEEGS